MGTVVQTVDHLRERLYPPRTRRSADRPEEYQLTVRWRGSQRDFGLEQVSGDERDRYKFRTSPLRNLALQPAFFHNGAFTLLEEAIAHHLDVTLSVRSYSPVGRLPDDLVGPLAPMDPVLARRDGLLRRPIRLTGQEFADLVGFVRTGLLDGRATAESFSALIPPALPSELEPLAFE